MYVQVACPEDGCDKTVLRKDLGKHTHDCLHRVLACDACGTAVRAYDLEVCVFRRWGASNTAVLGSDNLVCSFFAIRLTIRNALRRMCLVRRVVHC